LRIAEISSGFMSTIMLSFFEAAKVCKAKSISKVKNSEN
jgi:hypothetical protein